MPRYAKRYRKGPIKRRSIGNRSYYNNKYAWYNSSNVPTMAKYAWKGVKMIRELINVEKKFFDVTTTAMYNTTWLIYNLSNIPEGDDYNQRQGNSILAQSIFLRSKVTWNPAATGGQSVRMILLVDNDQRGVDPTAAELLEAPSTNITSPLLHTVSKRFNVLMDKVITLTPVDSTRNFKIYKKYNRHIKYQATSGADSACYEGNLYLFISSDQTASLPSVEWYHRLRYTDN